MVSWQSYLYNGNHHTWKDCLYFETRPWSTWITATHLKIGCHFNTLRLRQNERHFADDTFKHIFLNENVRISIKISLKFVPKGPINDIPALVQIMAWRPPGDKPLSEPMMVRLPTHICVTRPQWIKRSTGIVGQIQYKDCLSRTPIIEKKWSWESKLMTTAQRTLGPISVRIFFTCNSISFPCYSLSN